MATQKGDTTMATTMTTIPTPTRPAARVRRSSLSTCQYKPTVRHLGRRLFRVQSASSPAVHYLVDLNDDTCTCPNGQAGRTSCWHRKAARANEDARRQMLPAHPTIPARASGMAALQEAFGA